jgi:hypothetical protein
MAIGKFMRSGGMAALAAGLAVLALPAVAQAQDANHGRWNRGGGEAGAHNSNGGGSWRGRGGDGWRTGGDAGAQNNNGGGSWRGRDGGRGDRGNAQSATAPAPQAQAQPQRSWSRGDGNGGSWNRSSDTGNRPAWRGRSTAETPPPAQVETQRRAWNGTGQWQGRSTADRDNRRRGEDAARWRNDNRDYAWRGSNDYRWRGDRQNYAGNPARNWDRDWRRDDRYDWRGYRNAHRHTYRLGAYYAPYRNYSYRRLSAGFFLDTLFFGSRYWIDDPWQYRLPPAYGPYRWVRYYDDALLVDTYTGEVVDVIYSFFW